jgi:menaquinone-9 beta-reductase
MERFDVVVVGAGPSGAACAWRLKDAGLRVALLDRATFPRDKICGDALSVDVVNQLPLLSEKIEEAFSSLPGKVASYGVRLFYPDNTSGDLPFLVKGENKCGYICSRMEFDHFLFQQVKNSTNTVIIENCQVLQTEYDHDEMIVKTNKGEMRAAIVIGADGAHSVVNKLINRRAISRTHHCAGLRVYYEGVTGFHRDNFIELYFFKETLPGYLWIFPMEGNKANVGIGMLSSAVSKKKINLKELLDRLLSSNDVIKGRFKNAKPLESVKGHGLPLGSTKRAISGDRCLLLGDAAGLIDPFTGEGIGNAIRSGRVAAEHIIECFRQHNFSAAFNKAYDKEIYRRMWPELRVSRALQRLCHYPALLNFMMKKAAKSQYWQNFLLEIVSDTKQRKQFLNPVFYYRLLFK